MCAAWPDPGYVEESVYVEGITEQARSIKVGDGLDPDTTIGPLVSQEQFERVTGYIRSGRDGVATIYGGDRVGDCGYFVAPTVLTGTREDMTAVREEIFGPVVAAIPFIVVASAEKSPDQVRIQEVRTGGDSLPVRVTGCQWLPRSVLRPA